MEENPIGRIGILDRQDYRDFMPPLAADIKGFFDNLPHAVILGAIRSRVADGKVLDLIERFLSCGVMEDGRLWATTRGTPQGGVISPLLANIVLNHLDWQLDQAGYRFARYADDFVVLCKSRPQAEEALALVKSVLEPLGLALSEEKTRITTYRAGYCPPALQKCFPLRRSAMRAWYPFLGFILSKRSRRIRPKSLERFKDKVRDLTVRKHNFDLDAVVALNSVLRGIAQYFCAPFATNREQFHKLDSWIRMRMRSMKLKCKNELNNRKVRDKVLKERFGLLSLEDFYLSSHGLTT